MCIHNVTFVYVFYLSIRCVYDCYYIIIIKKAIIAPKQYSEYKKEQEGEIINIMDRYPIHAIKKGSRNGSSNCHNFFFVVIFSFFLLWIIMYYVTSYENVFSVKIRFQVHIRLVHVIDVMNVAIYMITFN